MGIGQRGRGGGNGGGWGWGWGWGWGLREWLPADENPHPLPLAMIASMAFSASNLLALPTTALPPSTTACVVVNGPTASPLVRTVMH